MPKFGVPTVTARRRLGAHREGIVYIQYLSETGASVSGPRDATYMVTVFDISAMSQTQLDFESRSLKLGGKYWCHGGINPGYIASQLREVTYLMKLVALNKRSSSQMQVGFAGLVNKGNGILYIDLICAKVGERVLASADLERSNAGSLMLKQVVAFAQHPEFGFRELTLAALPNVIGFYDKFGFRLDAPDSPELRSVTDNLRKFRFKSLEEYDMAYLVSAVINYVQPEDEAGNPLTPPQQIKLGNVVKSKLDKYPANQQAKLWKILGTIYDEAVADPIRGRLLFPTVEWLIDMGLTPHGIDNGISMVYTVPPHQTAGSASKRTTNRRRTTRKRSPIRSRVINRKSRAPHRRR